MPGLPARPEVPASNVVRAAQARLLARLDDHAETPSLSPTLPSGGVPSILDTPTSWPGPSAEPGPHESDERYEFGEPFAAGGLGVVRRARDRRLGRTIAVKELLRTDAAAERRFALEAAITARLQHPGIVPLYDIGRYPTGEPYYCMKLVEGQTLEHEIRKRPELRERLALLEQVIAAADAVAYAHRHGVIHRDLKPANILAGELGETVVIDWGLAKDTTLPGSDEASATQEPASGPAAISTMTEHGTVLGTLRYMPPEQARGEAVDARGDVFALGAVLYHVLAGVPPYDGVDQRVLASRVAEGAVDDLRTRVPEAPRELVAIAQRAMAARPDERYPGAEALAEDLRRFTTGRLVGAHRYSAGEVVKLWVRRHRAVVGVAAASLAALAVGGAYAFQNIRHERDAAATAQGAAESALTVAKAQTSAAVLAEAQAHLDRDLAATLTTLARLDMSDETVARRARLLALAAETRGAPARVLHGHAGVVREAVALADGALVSADVGGEVRKWDPASGRGELVHDFKTQDVVLVAARDVPVFAAIGAGSARVVRGGEVETIDVRMVEPVVAHLPKYRWELSAGAETLAALSTQTEMGGPPAYLWDLRQRPAAASAIAAERFLRAALSPDGATVVYTDTDRKAFLFRAGVSTPVPAILGAQAFSSSGAHLVAWPADRSKTAIAYTPATGATHPLGRDVLTIAPEDHAVIVDFDNFVGQAELSLRSLATGEARWAVSPVDSFSPMEWGDKGDFDVVADPRGEGLALRARDHWALGSRVDGVFHRKIATGPARVGTWAGDGRFVVAHNTELRVWNPAPPSAEAQALATLSAGALSPDGSRALVYTQEQPPVIRNMSDGTSVTSPCLAGLTIAGLSEPKWRPILDAQDRLLLLRDSGEACVSDRAGAHALTLPGKPGAGTLADASPGLAIGTAEGDLLVWRDVAAAPRTWQLGAAIEDVVMTRGGEGVLAFTRTGKVLALTATGDVPLELAALDPGPNERLYRPPPTFLHPRAPIAAIPLLDQDALAVHDFATGTTKRHALVLPAVPAGAYSPSGAALAVAAAGRRVLVLAGDGPAREIALPDEARGLAFVGEDELAVVGEDGALIRVDTRIGDAAVLKPAWAGSLGQSRIERRVTLAARPDGAVHAHTEGDYTLATHPADPVPREREALAAWLQGRRAELAH